MSFLIRDMGDQVSLRSQIAKSAIKCAVLVVAHECRGHIQGSQPMRQIELVARRSSLVARRSSLVARRSSLVARGRLWHSEGHIFPAHAETGTHLDRPDGYDRRF
jgi:hypothetical protein